MQDINSLYKFSPDSQMNEVYSKLQYLFYLILTSKTKYGYVRSDSNDTQNFNTVTQVYQLGTFPFGITFTDGYPTSPYPGYPGTDFGLSTYNQNTDVTVTLRIELSNVHKIINSITATEVQELDLASIFNIGDLILFNYCIDDSVEPFSFTGTGHYSNAPSTPPEYSIWSVSDNYSNIAIRLDESEGAFNSIQPLVFTSNNPDDEDESRFDIFSDDYLFIRVSHFFQYTRNELGGAYPTQFTISSVHLQRISKYEDSLIPKSVFDSYTEVISGNKRYLNNIDFWGNTFTENLEATRFNVSDASNSNVVTSHKRGNPSQGDNQNIYGIKWFNNAVSFESSVEVVDLEIWTDSNAGYTSHIDFIDDNYGVYGKIYTDMNNAGDDRYYMYHYLTCTDDLDYVDVEPHLKMCIDRSNEYNGDIYSTSSIELIAEAHNRNPVPSLTRRAGLSINCLYDKSISTLDSDVILIGKSNLLPSITLGNVLNPSNNDININCAAFINSAIYSRFNNRVNFGLDSAGTDNAEIVIYTDDIKHNTVITSKTQPDLNDDPVECKITFHSREENYHNCDCGAFSFNTHILPNFEDALGEVSLGKPGAEFDELYVGLVSTSNIDFNGVIRLRDEDNQLTYASLTYSNSSVNMRTSNAVPLNITVLNSALTISASSISLSATSTSISGSLSCTGSVTALGIVCGGFVFNSSLNPLTCCLIPDTSGMKAGSIFLAFLGQPVGSNLTLLTGALIPSTVLMYTADAQSSSSSTFSPQFTFGDQISNDGSSYRVLCKVSLTAGEKAIVPVICVKNQ